MKYFTLVLALFLSTQSFAIKSRKIVPTGGAPLGTDYTYSDGQSRALSELKEVYKHILINNTRSGQIACTIDNPILGLVQTASVLRDKEIVVPANQGYVLDNITTGPDIFCRSDNGSSQTSSEPIIIELW